MATTKRPIGYWLKHLDRLIEMSFDNALTEHDISRRHWQILDSLKESPRDVQALSEAIGPFLGEGAITLEAVIADLIGREWIARDGEERYALTPLGEAAHAAVAERVQALRGLVSVGLTADEYGATVDALRRMAQNLEGAAARSPNYGETR